MKRTNILTLGVSLLVLLFLFSAPILSLAAPVGPDGSVDNRAGALERAAGLGNTTGDGGACQITDFRSFVNCVTTYILTPLVALLIGIALAYFLVGVIKYIGKGGDEKERKAGVQMMTYGIIALFVMVAAWGLVNLLVNTFGFNYNTPPTPQFR